MGIGRRALRLGFPLVAALLAAACGDRARAPGHPLSRIEHLVVLIQENASFDAYFASYCRAPAGSGPTCTEGPECCETGPVADPGTGVEPTVLDDAEHGAFGPLNLAVCMEDAIDGGAMDRFVAGRCGNPRTFAYAPAETVGPYHRLASEGALADRWFQPVLGASSSNDMYFARAAFVFPDNAFVPESIGGECSFNPELRSFDLPTVGDLLADAGVPWAFYIQGYATMLDFRGRGECPPPDPACPAGIPFFPCVYDPSDIPFQYEPRFRDAPAHMRDLGRLERDLDAGELPPVAFVKALGFRTEHPGGGTTIRDGIEFVTGLVDRILASPLGGRTLILLTYDESGGYFDHVAPPPASPVDGKSYGPRVPAIAIGDFARHGHISHVTLEHSSIVRFIEWNWLGGRTGQLGTRDAVVHNIGSLLDPSRTGVPVPE